MSDLYDDLYDYDITIRILESHLEAKEARADALEAEVERLRAALREIAACGSAASPHIARRALGEDA